jgi:hypothetical protein
MLVWLLVLLGCSSPAAVEQPNYYIRFAKEVDSIQAPTSRYTAMTHIMLEAETNIPGWAWAVSSRDTIITQEGVNYGSVSWWSGIYWQDAYGQHISAVNCCSEVEGTLVGSQYIWTGTGMTHSAYGTRAEYRGRTDTVIAYAVMRDILISDTISIVIY